MKDEGRRVFSVIGTLPEPGGYAVAKFSRSARPYEEWILELTQEGASRFYEQFYFSYGHASIADLAHLTMIAENISIVAAIDVLDEQLVDAQESSTRYQSFTRRRYYTPPEIIGSRFEIRYRDLCDRLFTLYRAVHESTIAHLSELHSPDRPPAMSDETYRLTVRARAFDTARYILPSSTYTGLGYLCSARTLERQIRRLASSPLHEVQAIADELRDATTRPAYNPLALRVEPELQAFLERSSGPDLDGELARFAGLIRQGTLSGAAAAPTLVRHTAPSPYPDATYRALRTDPRQRQLDALPLATSRGVALATAETPEVELAATLLYRESRHSYQQILAEVRRWPQEEIDRIGALAFAERGPHDDSVREARVGYQLVFDLCLDNGAFRDLHRHRNCIQVMQPFTAALGFDTPPLLDELAERGAYQSLLSQAGELADQLEDVQPGLGQYVLPLAYRRRALFKMDAAELAYIVETRTRPAGHFSYREITHEMYTAFAARHPALARHIRATSPAVEEFFER